ncbi:hypothetical protein B6D52_02380 [Candidatus Parcubacteria bacterium 4484_255]|nr:MAG: hypothetical protein B6D52_02380 [Candidatus Parcubacteria bacterium 4484_255]
MDNPNNKQPEDIFEDIGPKPIIKKENNKEKYSSKDSENPSNKPSYEVEPHKKGKDIFILITRLLIILAIIIAIGFVVLYFWNKFKNKNVLIEDETLTELADNTTSTPLIVPKEIKEKPLDTDSDGLSDVEEKQLKTKIDNPDTDNDGLSDRLEVKIYFTNPLKADTDKDGMSDGDEVRRGLDPDNPSPGAKLFDLQKEIKALEH